MSTYVINYIKTVERLYRCCEGEELSRMISLRDAHVAHEDIRTGEIALVAPIFSEMRIQEMINAHLYCAWALHEKDYKEAYKQQTKCVMAIVRILQKEQNWCLPLIYTACLDLRLIAQKAESFTEQSDGKILEEAAQSLLSCYRVCADDIGILHEETKKVGMLYIVNQLLKIYFRMNKLDLYEPLISAIIASSQLWYHFSLAQRVTYGYFVGRKAVWDLDCTAADEYLSYAFRNCHGQSHKNERLILTYLIPVKMLTGYMPTPDLLQKYDLLQFADLITTVKNGDLRGIDRIMEEHESFFISAGIYLIIEKLKIIAYRNLFKKVYLVENNRQIDIVSFQAALQMMGEDVDLDETQCIVANLIFKDLIKGYISYHHKKVVLRKHNAFPTPFFGI